MKKLVLKKEVVAAMNDNQLSHLKGGGCGCGCDGATPLPVPSDECVTLEPLTTEIYDCGIGSEIKNCCTWQDTGCYLRASIEGQWGDICAPTPEF